MVSSDPRSKPVLGSEVISGQITDKASALYDLLNQVTGTEGGSYKTFDIDDPDSDENYQLDLGVYSIEKSSNARAWQTVERIYFQDSGQRLQQIEGTLRDNFDRLRNDITSNISSLLDLINKSEADDGVAAGDVNKSILDEIKAVADDVNSTTEDVDDIIHALLTSEDAINRLIEALFTNFQLDVQRLDSEIFDLLDDGDGTFSNSGGSETDTTESTKYFLDFGRGHAAKIANSQEEALDFTLDFLKKRFEDKTPGAVWNEAAQIGLQVTTKFQSGRLLLDPLLIDEIIAAKNIDADELKTITNQKDFLAKFSTMREFMDFAAAHHVTADDAATFKELFKNDLIERTPKYYEDQRSLLDVLKGKADDFDNSITSKVFEGAADKITTAAKGAAQLLGSGYNKLAVSNFEDFVRDNPLLLMEHLLTQKAATTDTDELARLNQEINSLQEFQTRHLDNLTSWLQAKNEQLAKTKKIIERLEIEAASPNTEPQRRTEIEAKIDSLINSSKTNDAGLQAETLRSRAAFTLIQLNALGISTTDTNKLTAINKDIELIQNILLVADDVIAEQAIRNGAAIVINKTIANDLKSIKDQTKLINLASNSIAESEAIITEIKEAYNNHDFLRLGEISEADKAKIDNKALTEIINTVLRTKNAHAALYASETLESGKINAQFANKKLATPGEDGSLPEDNQLAPPQIAPTASSAAIAALGNQILLKVNNLLNEKKLPDETWVVDNAQIINDINTRIIADPSLSSAGEVFFNQLRTIFATTISRFFNTHSSERDDLDDAKTTSLFVENLSKTSNLGNDATAILQDVEAAITRLGTSNPEIASDKIFVDPSLEKSIKSIKKFVERKNLDYETENFKNQINLDALKRQIAELNATAAQLDNINASIASLQGLIVNGTDDGTETTWNGLVSTLARDLQILENEVSADQRYTYLRNENLQEIQTRLQAIEDGTDPSLNDFQDQLDDANAEFNSRVNDRDEYISQRSILQNLDPIDEDSQEQIDILNGLINLLNGNGSNSINNARSQRDNAQSQITAIRNRAQALLAGNADNIGIDELLTHLNTKKDAVIVAMDDYNPAITGLNIQQRLNQYEKALSKDFSTNLINSDSLDDIQNQLNAALSSTSFDLNGDDENDFDSIQTVIDRIDGLANDVTNIFGSSYDKAQKLNQLENALITKQVLQAELAQALQAELDAGPSTERADEISQMLIPLLDDIEDLGDINEEIKIDNNTILRKILDPQFINSPTSQAKIDAISKILYGFETNKLDNGETETIIGSADSMKDKSLIDGIKDLKIEARKILDMEIPEDETDLVNLLDNKKADFGGIEQQSIKRLILLMFILSMLEYSDWEYQKTEADQSRYAVS